MMVRIFSGATVPEWQQGSHHRISLCECLDDKNDRPEVAYGFQCRQRKTRNPDAVFMMPPKPHIICIRAKTDDRLTFCFLLFALVLASQMRHLRERVTQSYVARLSLIGRIIWTE
jgi:hypothetical protein